MILGFTLQLSSQHKLWHKENFFDCLGNAGLAALGSGAAAPVTPKRVPCAAAAAASITAAVSAFLVLLSNPSFANEQKLFPFAYSLRPGSNSYVWQLCAIHPFWILKPAVTGAATKRPGWKRDHRMNIKMPTSHPEISYILEKMAIVNYDGVVFYVMSPLTPMCRLCTLCPAIHDLRIIWRDRLSGRN